MISSMSRTGSLYYVAGALAALAAAVVIVDDGFQAGEYGRAALYAFWAAVMFALGYRARQRSR